MSEEVKETPELIPTPTSWQWNPEDQIVISGQEFNLIQQYLKGVVEPAVVAVNTIFKRMQEQGIAKPVDTPQE